MRQSRLNLRMDDFAAAETPEHVRNIAARDELARDLGYHSVREMMEQTELVPLPSGEYAHLTTDSDGDWVAWREQPCCDIRRFDSRQAALLELRENVNLVFTQS